MFWKKNAINAIFSLSAKTKEKGKTIYEEQVISCLLFVLIVSNSLIFGHSCPFIIYGSFIVFSEVLKTVTHQYHILVPLNRFCDSFNLFHPGSDIFSEDFYLHFNSFSDVLQSSV